MLAFVVGGRGAPTKLDSDAYAQHVASPRASGWGAACQLTVAIDAGVSNVKVGAVRGELVGARESFGALESQPPVHAIGDRDELWGAGAYRKFEALGAPRATALRLGAAATGAHGAVAVVGITAVFPDPVTTVAVVAAVAVPVAAAVRVARARRGAPHRQREHERAEHDKSRRSSGC